MIDPSFDDVFTRKELLRLAGVGVGTLAASPLVAAAPAKAARTGAADIPARFGVAIPQVNVRQGVQVSGDHSFYVIGMRNGWYKDVGITVKPPPLGFGHQYDQVISVLTGNRVDITTWWGPFQVQSMVRAPNVKMVGFSDTYVGTYILASPDTKAKPVARIMKEKKLGFREAMKQTFAQIRGKRVALDNTGSHRNFFDTIFSLGGLRYEDVDLTTVDDEQIVLLGRGGHIDFASPAGAVQNVALIQLGWYPVVAVNDLLKNLPAGDPRVVTGIGHCGPASTVAYYTKNRDTVLRHLSVMFRMIDALNRDLRNKTDDALKLQLPYMESVNAVRIGVEGLRQIFRIIDPLKSFEAQREYWLEKQSPFYYENIYNPQILEAQKGGVLPKDRKLPATQAFGAAAGFYKALVSYRERYDDLRPRVARLKGERRALAKEAERQYRNRNYLDAFRMMQAAVRG